MSSALDVRLLAAGLRRYLMRSSVTRRHVRSHCRLVICVFASQSLMHWANRDCSSANQVSELALPVAAGGVPDCAKAALAARINGRSQTYVAGRIVPPITLAHHARHHSFGETIV